MNGLHSYAAWFLPHPSCWITAPIRATGKHVNALCTPPLAATLIDQERAASLSMWSWGGDPSMPKVIDIQGQLTDQLERAWNWSRPGEPPANKHPMKHMFHLEYDYLDTRNSSLWPRCCHMHVGVALDTAVQPHGVVYLEQVPEAYGGGCRTGYTLFQGPPLVVTLSVPYSTVGNAMPMAQDVASFLSRYTWSDSATYNHVWKAYGLYESRVQAKAEDHRAHPVPGRRGVAESRRYQDALLEDYSGRGEEVQVITCKLDGLRYQIPDSDATRIADAQNEGAHPITVPIETYLRNGIAVLLRDHQRGGMIARAFGMGPRMEWQGDGGRRPSDAHNIQGVLAAMLSNDLREATTWGEWIRPRKYKIKGVVNGRTVIMRDRPRYYVPNADGDAEVDPTDPSQTEPAGMAHRNRVRHTNVMACAEIVLENDQLFMPWQRS